MPVVTRSCSKQRNRPRIEEETPATTNTVRYVTRSSAKRKILQQENEVKDLEPPKKIAATKRSSRTSLNTSNNSSLKENNNTTVKQKQKQKRGINVKSGGCHTSRIPRRNPKENKTVLLHSSREHINKENDKESQNDAKSLSDLTATSGVHEVISKTPAGCIAARIRSYSALRRSQHKKNNKEWHHISDNVNEKSPLRSPFEEVSFNPRIMVEGHDSDEDILWKMNRCLESEKDAQNASSDDETSYKNKYFTLMTAMKQLQNTFLKAQKNAEKNVKVSDKLLSELKSSLSLEKQKCSLLNEEVKIKKGAVERLRSDLENAKEQLECMKEEKENLEKQDREKSEKKQNHLEAVSKNKATEELVILKRHRVESLKEHNSNEAILKNKATDELVILNRQGDESLKEGNNSNEAISENQASQELQLIADQKSVINFYSRLTGISLSCDNTSQGTSSFQSFNCTFFPDPNSTHSLQFRLTHDKEFDEIEYSPNPRSPGSEDVLKSLPDYLQENIFFGADQAPKFLAKLLKTAE